MCWDEIIFLNYILILLAHGKWLRWSRASLEGRCSFLYWIDVVVDVRDDADAGQNRDQHHRPIRYQLIHNSIN